MFQNDSRFTQVVTRTETVLKIKKNFSYVFYIRTPLKAEDLVTEIYRNTDLTKLPG